MVLVNIRKWRVCPNITKIVSISLTVIGAAALCLFPLWPDWMRILVYWCSLLGASFVGFMLFLIVRKYYLTFYRHGIYITKTYPYSKNRIFSAVKIENFVGKKLAC